MPIIQKSAWQQWQQQSNDQPPPPTSEEDEATVRYGKRGGSIKRNETFAAADGLYQSRQNKRREEKLRYTVPLFPPFFSGQNAEAPPDLFVRTSLEPFEDVFNNVATKKAATLSRDHIHQLTTVVSASSPDDDHQFSPGARSASSGFGSSGLGSSYISFRSNTNRSLTAFSPDSALSLFSSSTPSKIGSIGGHNNRLELPRISYLSDLESSPRSTADTKRFEPCQLSKLQRPSTTETKFVTTVFEVLQRGLTEIAGSIRDEMARFYDQGLVIVCCEMRWSTPDPCRDIRGEIELKNDVLRGLRVNNKRVLDSTWGQNEYMVFPDSITEELVARRPGYFGGSYRRYYAGLLPLTHTETAKEHEPWWKLRKSVELDDDIDWPLIAHRTRTTVVVLNMICMKMDRF